MMSENITMRLLVKQERQNQKLKKEAITDELIQEQIEINKKRNEHNIIDHEEVIYLDEEEKEFVQ